MTRNQKILLGLAGAGVLAYLLFRGSKAQAQSTSSGVAECSEDEEKISFRVMNKDRSYTTKFICKKAYNENGEQFYIGLRPEDCPAGTHYEVPPRLGGPGYVSDEQRKAEQPLCVSNVLGKIY